jgi:hypothetical protein
MQTRGNLAFRATALHRLRRTGLKGIVTSGGFILLQSKNFGAGTAGRAWSLRANESGRHHRMAAHDQNGNPALAALPVMVWNAFTRAQFAFWFDR